MIGCAGKTVMILNVFWPAQSSSVGCYQSCHLTSPKSSTALWCERCGFKSSLFFLFLPHLPSFLSASSFCLIQASRVSPASTPFHSAAAIPWLIRQGNAVPCATWWELAGAGGADNSHFHCLLSAGLKLQMLHCLPVLLFALVFSLLLPFFLSFSAEIRTGF